MEDDEENNLIEHEEQVRRSINKQVEKEKKKEKAKEKDNGKGKGKEKEKGKGKGKEKEKEKEKGKGKGKGKEKEKEEKGPSTRFDVLARPQKRNILGTYNEHAHHFPKDRVSKIKHKLQELFDVTPEETEKHEKEKEEKVCRTRFDVLATPQKRNILGTYQEHAHHFPKDRASKIKHKLQELFAMTPEETQKYFEQMRNETNEIAKQKMMKAMLKKTFKNKQRAEQEKKAMRLVERLLKHGMMHAFNNPVPPLISVRLRNLSDIILEQICDLRNVDIPERDNPSKSESFLIAVADWIAIAIEHIYYNVQLKKNKELVEIENQVATMEKEKKKEEKEKEKQEKEGKKDDKKEEKEGKKDDKKEKAGQEKKKKGDETEEDEYDEMQGFE